MVIRRLTTEDFIREAMVVHGDMYDYSRSDYVNPTTKICIICPKHGEFWQLRKTHVQQRHGCLKCGYEKSNRGNVRLTEKIFIERAIKVHGNKYDYSKVKWVNHSTSLCIICPLHGDFTQKGRTHLSGAGCAKCAQIKVSGCLNGMMLNGQTNPVITTEEFISRAREVHGQRYDYSKSIYISSKNKIEIICLKHGSFWKSSNNHIRHEQGCPKCQLSKGEVAIAIYLDKAAIDYEMQKTYSGLVSKKGRSLKFDFYVPSRNMLIEYDGEQHFGCRKYKNHILSEESIENLQKNDMAKDQYAFEHGIPMLRIPFTQKDEIAEILKEKVINAPIVKDRNNLLSYIIIQNGETF